MNGNTVAVNNNNNNSINGVDRSESVSRNSLTPSPIANGNGNGVAAGKAAVNGGTAAAATVDLLEQPYGNLERAITAKLRNLEKRRLKLQQKSEAASKGAALTSEQREALSKAGEVEQQIEYVKELVKLLEKQQKLYQRARKNEQRKKKASWPSQETPTTTTGGDNEVTPTPPPSEADTPAQADSLVEATDGNKSAGVDEKQDELPDVVTNGDCDVQQSTENGVAQQQLEPPAAGKSAATENVALANGIPSTNGVAPLNNAVEAQQAAPQPAVQAPAAEALVNGGPAPEVFQNGKNGIVGGLTPSESAAAPAGETLATVPAVVDGADGPANRRHSNHHHNNYRRSYPRYHRDQQQQTGGGKPFYPRGNRHQRQYNNGPRNAENGNNSGAEVASGDSGEGEFVKPTTFVRRRNVEHSPNSNNTNGVEVNGEVNGQPNGHHNNTHHYNNNHYHHGRPAYRKYRSHPSQSQDAAVNGENGTAPAVVENGVANGDAQPNGQDGQAVRPQRYSNGYRGPPRHSNGENANGRPFHPRPRPYHNNNGQGGRQYEQHNSNNNNYYYDRKDRSHYYKHTATHRQPLECGFVFSAHTD